MVANYEAMMIFTVTKGEEAISALQEKFTSLISANGTVEKIDEWGKRRLAYPINDETEGFYVLVNFSSETSFPAEIDRIAKITDGVLRLMVIKK